MMPAFIGATVSPDSRSGVNLHQCKGRKAQQHNLQVFNAFPQRQFHISAVALAHQERGDEIPAEKQVNRNRQR